MNFGKFSKINRTNSEKFAVVYKNNERKKGKNFMYKSILGAILCLLFIFTLFTFLEGTNLSIQNDAVKIDGEIMKTEKVEQGIREVTVKATEGENTVIIKFFVYKEDNFIGKAGEHFSGKISSDNIVSSETVKTETEKEQN